ncbi:MAG: sulfatase-like hydrolase/transferase, partial [Anaerolineae bacterium]
MSSVNPMIRPNILWICTDQQRYDTVNALGCNHALTPNLDRLVEQGVAFTRAYSQSPVCTPSRASFLTGCYPSTIHVNRNGNAFFPSDITLVTRALADAGYDCGLVGKLHLSAADGRVEPRPDDGYRVFKWSHHPMPEPCWPTAEHDYQAWLERQGQSWDELYP